jgi:hypothetical protein
MLSLFLQLESFFLNTSKRVVGFIHTMHKGAAFGRANLSTTLVCFRHGVVRTADQMRCIGKRDQKSQLSFFEQGAGNAYPYLVLKGIAEGGDLYPLRVKGEGTADETFVEVELLGNGRKIPSCDALG